MTNAKNRDRLRIAIQKSGRMADVSQDLLARCGLKFRQSRDKLFCFGESMPIDLLLVRDDDIPGLIAQGVCDLGIVGRNVLAEQTLASRASGEAAPGVELRPLNTSRCRLSIAVPQEMDYASPRQLQGLRIATSYPALLGDWLARNGVEAKVVFLAGSVEIAPRLGTADLICDLVSSGATLAANQLKEAVVLLDSEAVIAGPEEMPLDERGELRELLLRRIDGVIQVRESKLVMLHAARAAIETIRQILPNAQTPTLLPIEGSPDQVALQAVCYGAVTWTHLEDMKRAGASQLLVLPVEKILA
ncbi:MAG: ATP phosphoribosyltransferase [Proteobacteria bacterium]|uniref:ATP phosphoribosyltransferase n=1 Tax=Rudaea sp. TaxID=2136325 RepID=UPI00322022F3|nr:ATP phosphoribosyltransferase [Pseudomonadota bacterium]